MNNIDLRDWFAGQALAGSMANQASSLAPESFAQWAYGQADAMLVERAKATPQPKLANHVKVPREVWDKLAGWLALRHLSPSSSSYNQGYNVAREYVWSVLHNVLDAEEGWR